MSKAREVYGLTIVKAPGGGLVLVAGPIDLSRAESLSPRWEREVKATKPTEVELPPDETGRVFSKVIPVLTVIGKEVVHGEGVQLMQRHVNREMGKLLNAAMMGEAIGVEQLEKLQRPTKAAPKRREETAKQKHERAERALGFTNLPDEVVRKRLLAMGRTKSATDKYLEGRSKRGAA